MVTGSPKKKRTVDELKPFEDNEKDEGLSLMQRGSPTKKWGKKPSDSFELKPFEDSQNFDKHEESLGLLHMSPTKKWTNPGELKPFQDSPDNGNGFGLGGLLKTADVKLDSEDDEEPQKPTVNQLELKSSANSYLEDMMTEIYESAYKLPTWKEDLRDWIETEMNVFALDNGTENPQLEDIFGFVKLVCFNCKMEDEIPIVALVYIEKLLKSREVLMNEENWRGLVLTTLCIASKIWDDDSLENEHFPKVLKEFTLRQISKLEKSYLALIDFDIVIKGKEYAQSLFILQSLADEQVLLE